MKKILLMGLLIIGCGSAENGMGPELTAQKATDTQQTPEELRNHWVEWQIVGEWKFDPETGEKNERWLILNDDFTWLVTDRSFAYASGIWQISNAGRELRLQADSGDLSFNHGDTGREPQNIALKQGDDATAVVSLGRDSLTLRFGNKTVVLWRP